MCCAEVFSPCGLCWLFSCHLLRQIWMFAFWYEVTLSVKGPVRRLSGTHAQIKFSSYEVIDFVAAVKFRLCGWCNDFVMCLCVTFLSNPSLWLVLASARGLGVRVVLQVVTSISAILMKSGVWGFVTLLLAFVMCRMWCDAGNVVCCGVIWYDIMMSDVRWDVMWNSTCDVWCVMQYAMWAYNHSQLRYIGSLSTNLPLLYW